MVRRNRFWFAAAAFEGCVFLLNARSRAQGNQFTGHHLVAAMQLVAGHGYSDLQGQPAFYPMPGYPLLMIPGILVDHERAYLLGLQWILALLALRAAYHMFGATPKIAHLVLLLPYFALVSETWPDAMAGILIPFVGLGATRFVEEGKRRHLALCSMCAGLLSLLRAEYLVLPVFMLALSFLPRPRATARRTLILALATAAGIFLAVLPWGLRSMALGHRFRATSSNGGGLLYISLGQLPGNPWHIVHDDYVYFDFAAARGLGSPYSTRGDSALRGAFLAAITHEPLAFAHKVARNAAMAVVGGVFTGEFALWISDQPDDIRVRGRLGTGSFFARAARVPGLPAPALCTVLLYAVFVPVTLVLFAALAVSLVQSRSPHRLAHAVVFVLVAHCVAIIAVAQWEPRHMNPVYALLVVSGIAQWVRWRDPVGHPA